MSAIARQFTMQHLIAAGALGGIAALSLQAKLEGMAVGWSPAARQLWSDWWPLTLIAAGMLLWLIHGLSEKKSRKRLTPLSSGRTL